MVQVFFVLIAIVNVFMYFRHYQLVSKLKYSQGMSYSKDFIIMIMIIIKILLIIITIFTVPSCTIYASINLLKAEDSIKLCFDFLKPNS